MFEMLKIERAPKRRTTLAAIALAGGLALAGCAGGGTGPGAGTADPAPGSSMMGGSSMGGPGMGGGHGSSPGAGMNADVMFVRMMIPHHEQAVRMSDTMLAKSGLDTPLVDLANKIKAAQGPEIEQMESWLDEWGQPSMPAGSSGQMGGMMGQGDLDSLEAAEGDSAARLFLTQMIAHHRGAVQMAEREVANGSNQDVKDLAARMAADQKAEITVMEDLLADYQ